MRNISSAFSRALANDKRDYQNRLRFTLADSTVFDVYNSQLWDDGLNIEDAVSNDNVFQIGAAIINQCTVVLNNIYNEFSEYNFDGAKIVVYTGLQDLDDGSSEEIKLGTYEVDEPSYDGSLITLKCLDNMSKFDKAYETTLGFPATLFQIVSDACNVCGVPLDTSSLNFPHKDYIVSTKPSGDNTTFRQVISWAAQIACCFARCNVDGNLEIKWYNTGEFDNFTTGIDGGVFDSRNVAGSYVSGDTADGGTFNPWNTGDEYDGGTFADFADIHFIHSSYSSQISTDNVVITGVKVVKKIKVDGASDVYEEYTSGTTGYVVSIEGNDLIDGTHGQDIADWVGTAINGLAFRKASLTHPSDPSIEAGDVAIYFDENDNAYPILVSSTTFTPGNSQKTVSSAETPKKNSAQRFSETTRNYVEIRQRLIQQRSAWEEVAENLSERIDNASGLYCTEVTEQGATKTYYHNKPVLEESDILMLFSTVGFTLSADGGTTWYGMTVDGQMIASILNTVGVNADWINTGALSVKDSSNREILYANADTGIVRINAYNGATTKTFYFDSTNGTLKMKGELSIGGNNNQNGFIEVFDSSNNRVGRWDGSKIYLGGISGTSLSNPLTELSSSNGLISRRNNAGTNIKAHVYNGIVSGTVGDYTKYQLDYNNFVLYGDNSTTRRTVINDHSISLRNTSGTTVVEMYVATPGNGCLTLNNLTVTDIKSKVVDTNYGNKLAYCYEMPSPMYGDIGSSTIGDDGVVFVDIDPVFADYIYENGEYYVFLQNEGEGKSYVSQKTKKYFVISGTPGLKVAWEIKAKQADSHWMRSEDYTEDIEDGNNINYEEQAFADVMNYLNMEVTT